jgi:UDP-glucose 4-epimerase
MVFSSSCTVYGLPKEVPITEAAALSAINPYGRTKLFQEEMFRDLSVSDPSWRTLLLRCGIWGLSEVQARPFACVGCCL